VRFSCAARTDTGIVRSGNEDNYLMLADRGVFIVADGMGGHAAGEVASEMAVRIVSRELGTLRGLTDDQAGERMRQAVIEANSAIFDRTLTEHDKRGMGTTTTALILLPQRYILGQVGDSRAYLLRGDHFLQVTKDHSYVQEQVDLGLLTPEQARGYFCNEYRENMAAEIRRRHPQVRTVVDLGALLRRAIAASASSGE